MMWLSRPMCWLLGLLITFQVEKNVNAAIDDMMLQAEQDYENAHGTSRSSFSDWYDYHEEGRNETFVRLQYDMLISKETWNEITDTNIALPSRSKRNAVNNQTRLWPNKKIFYYLDESFNGTEQNEIYKALMHWMDFTCLTFKEADLKKDFNYVKFVKFEEGCGESLVGMMGGTQSLKLGPRCVKHDVIIHEIGHVLGLYHEHMRANRDNYVKINHDNIEDSEEARYNFDKLKPMDYNNYSKPYDYLSIMHYGKFFYSRDKKANLTTIEPLNETFLDIIGEAEKLSFHDVKIVCEMYGCTDNCKENKCLIHDSFTGKNCDCYCKGANRFTPIVECDLEKSCGLPIDVNLTEHAVLTYGNTGIVEDLNKVFLRGTELEIRFIDQGLCGYDASIIKCDEGNWTGKLPVCVPAGCYLDSYPQLETEYNITTLENNDFQNDADDQNDAGTADEQDYDYRYFDDSTKIEMRCKKAPEVSALLTCKYGNWTGVVPPCETAKECKVTFGEDGPFDLYHNGTQLRTGNSVKHKTQVQWICKTADSVLYYDYGDEEINVTCINGKWEGLSEINCPVPKECLLENGNKQGSRLLGYTLTCNKGYHLSSSREFTCNIAGKWAPTAPLCIPNPCIIPADRTIGNVMRNNVYLSGRSRVNHTEQVIFKCPFGMYPDTIKITCNFGQWNTPSGQLPTCQQVICPPPNITWSLYQPVKKEYVYKETVSMQGCKGKKEYHGDMSLSCMKNGTWSGKAKCKPFCPEGTVWENFDNKAINGNRKLSTQPWDFDRCKDECMRTRIKNKFCKAIQFGYNSTEQKLECWLHTQNPITNPELLTKMPYWTVLVRTCT